MSGRGLCPSCKKEYTVTAKGFLRSHGCDPAKSYLAWQHTTGQPNPHRAPLPTTQPAPKEKPVADVFDTAGDNEEPKRDRWGRYLLPHPETGKEQPWQRVTTFTKMTSDMFGLGQWQQRMVAKGLSMRPDLVALASTLDVKRDKAKMDGLTEEAKNAAGAKASANLGTALHSFTEDVDSGQALNDVPEAHRPDIRAYMIALESAGIQVIPGMIERRTVVPEFGVGGTLDRGLFIPRDSPAGRSLGLAEDTNVIGDVKTGATLDFGWGEIAIQLALYAHGINEVGVWEPRDRRWLKGLTMAQDFGIVMHIPAGTAQCTLYTVDLSRGWAAAGLNAQVREWRKAQGLSESLSLSPEPSPFLDLLAQAVGEPGRLTEPEAMAQWKAQFAAVGSRAQANELYRKAKANPSVTTAFLAELVQIGKTALTS